MIDVKNKLDGLTHYEVVKYCLATNNMKLLEDYINSTVDNDDIYDSWDDDYSGILTDEEFFDFIICISKLVNVCVPQYLLNKAKDTFNDKTQLVNAYFLNNADFRKMLANSCNPYEDDELNPWFKEFTFELSEDLITKVFHSKEMKDTTFNPDSIPYLVNRRPGINLYNVLPTEFLPYIVYLSGSDRYLAATHRAIDSWFMEDKPNDKELVHNLFSSSLSHNNRPWIDPEQLFIFFKIATQDKSIVSDLNEISSRYFGGQYLKAFKLLFLFNHLGLGDYLLRSNEEISEDFIKKLKALLILDVNNEYVFSSLDEIIMFDLGDFTKKLPSEAKDYFPEAHNPLDFTDHNFFGYSKSLAFIYPNGEFEEIPVISHEFTMNNKYKSICPDGVEIEEFKQYEDCAKNGVIVFVVFGKQVTVFLPYDIIHPQGVTLFEKVGNTEDGFEIYANIYGEDFAEDMFSGYSMERDDFLLALSVYCSIQDTKQK